MKIGIPKEIKNNENRVGMVPSGVKQLVQDGHQVMVERSAGLGIGISDQQFIAAGATILSSLEDIFEQSEMIIKVKEPQPRELALLRPHHTLYTYLHLAADRELTMGLMESGATSVAYETIQLDDGSLPLLTPMSEVAGRMATQVGAAYLQLDKGGKGVLLGGVPGVRRSKVTVIGCGVAGTNAMKMAVGLGADVTAIDISLTRLAEIDDLFDNRITTLYSNHYNIEESVKNSDLVIGAVLVAGARAPKLVTRQMISQMEKGSVVVDIAVDQGGCIETCHPTTHENPTFEVDGVVHYCVANMPGAVAQTSAYALTNATLRHARMIADKGIVSAARQDHTLMLGINTFKGKLVYRQVARDLDLPYSELEAELDRRS
ncbi:MAG: alanine dehydrogenase [Bdellovibrionales bacterium]|jgi:alanine dehydrogenase|nr:alanine dehydrogenase [Bdellovibrionales bacterium]MBT3527248.1 alanine dehydrogenase [Bdellovibrionales bacterium]MBT7767860.1 alanine dehydrogenase [Bdellovibrionales bacterium]